MRRRAADEAGGPSAPLVAGVGARRGVPVSEVLELITAACAAAGYAASQVVALATVAAKAAEPGPAGAARALGVPLLSYPAEALAAVRVPDPSAAAAAAVGTPSVAEAAALLAAGPGAALVAGKRKSAPPARATCALARPAVTDSGALTAGREGATAVPCTGAVIVMTSPNPPRRGPDRRTGVVGDPAPESATTGTKETQ
ncbi:cobalamin biosynthesis protein [Streptomyces decoyicus]|uniref:cobalamin biosynthesis protein n=1 Tax=Streptomyces decoyicus TaxID=249567 RepID=UPI0007C69A65|nr:cobalamin biosynthesis protein [Streptomyces decoyicus]